jgi:hypothetical protein
MNSFLEQVEPKKSYRHRENFKSFLIKFALMQRHMLLNVNAT